MSRGDTGSIVSAYQPVPRSDPEPSPSADDTPRTRNKLIKKRIFKLEQEPVSGDIYYDGLVLIFRSLTGDQLEWASGCVG
jgi:hypothetical protein